MMTVHKELKKEIFNWLLENENKWQRLNACKDEFRRYIFNEDGEFLIGGREVYDFIFEVDTLLYKDY